MRQISAPVIRVLHCVVKMDRGGYETLLMNVYRNIDRARIQFDFVTSFPGCFDEEILALGGRIHQIPFITKVGPFVYASKLRKIFSIYQEYKIVHSHMDKFSGMVLRQAAASGIPIRIAHSHNTRNEGGLAYQIVKNYYGSMICRYATDLWACSRAAANWMYGTKAATAKIINNGVDLECFKPNSMIRQQVRKELDLEKAYVIGNVGRFTKQKNHEFLLGVFGEVIKKEPNAQLLLIGDGPLRNQIRQKAMTQGLLPRIHFLGVRDDIPALLQAMDAFCFPSRHEGLGISVIEAQAAGLPCVVSEQIPQEAFVTSQIRKLPLKAPVKQWAEQLLKGKHIADPMTKQLQAFDIKNIAAEWQQCYLQWIDDITSGSKNIL